MLFAICLMLFRGGQWVRKERESWGRGGDTKKGNVIILIGIKSMGIQRKLVIGNEKNDFVEDTRFKANF